MNFNWFLIFNLTTFIDADLTSRKIRAVLDGIGQKDILITYGNEVAMVYEDVILPVEFQGENPFIRQGDDNHYAVYRDLENNIWLGIEA
jgi:hypothetical protein